MTVNDDLKKLVRKKEKTTVSANRLPKKTVDMTYLYQFVSLGVRVALVYVFYIYIGKLIADYFNFQSAMLYAILLATIQVIYIIFRIIKGFK